MLKLDNDLLQQVGLGGLPEDQKKAMLQHIYDQLELRVGTELANQMTDAQLTEFEQFIDAGGDNNQPEALKWLETNLPNYKQVVQQVFEQLKAEITQLAPQIIASTPGAQMQAPQAPQAPVQPQQMSPQPQLQQPYSQAPPQPQQPYGPVGPAHQQPPQYPPNQAV
ncbi:MAG: DUF5663 domain-containing protein [Candidatus Saccharimonadales bacterium]